MDSWKKLDESMKKTLYLYLIYISTHEIWNELAIYNKRRLWKHAEIKSIQ